nr:unnamed protein product [Callosobruchus analis]
MAALQGVVETSGQVSFINTSFLDGSRAIPAQVNSSTDCEEREMEIEKPAFEPYIEMQSKTLDKCHGNTVNILQHCVIEKENTPKSDVPVLGIGESNKSYSHYKGLTNNDDNSGVHPSFTPAVETTKAYELELGTVDTAYNEGNAFDCSSFIANTSSSDADMRPSEENISITAISSEMSSTGEIFAFQIQNHVAVRECDALQPDSDNISNKEDIKKQKKRRWDKKDYCPFCELDVIKFSRHIIRNHTDEVKVAEILSLKARDRKRIQLFKRLRNEGNFLKTAYENAVTPVRKPLSPSCPVDTSNYLPCKYCKGFYKKNYLYKHVNRCPHNFNKGEKSCAKTDGQSLLSYTPKIVF